SGFILIALLLVLPGALQEYNIERLYFQQLITWAPAGVFGGLIVLGIIKKMRTRYLVLASLYVAQLLFYTGFIFNFTGGPALISTTNYGEDYEKFYTHQGEIDAAKWLGERVGNLPIFTSSPGRNKLSAYAQVPASHVIIDTYPTIVGRNAYVYLTYINTTGGKSLFVLGGEEHAFNFQGQFFDDNKDKVYTNG